MNLDSTNAAMKADPGAIWTRSGFVFIFIFAGAIMFSISAAQMAVSCAAVCWVARWRAEGKAPSCSPLCVPLAAFILLSLAAALLSMDQRESIKDSKDLFHLVLFWVGYDYFRRDPGKIATFLRVSAGAGGLSAMVGLVQALNRGITLENRIRGFNDTYMTYAGLLSLAFVAAVAVTLYDYRKRQDAWIPPAMALMALAIVLSLTRSSFLGAMTGALVILIPRKPLAALVIPILVALGLALAPHGVSGRFSAMFDATSPANTERVHVWRGGARMLGDHPFFGVGQNCFPKAYPKFRDADVVEKGISHLHNNMLELAVERGIPCMAAWISIWAAAYWLMIRAWRRGGGTRGPNALGLAAGIGGITAFLAEGMFEYNFGDAEPQMLALLILGAGMAAAARTEESFLPR